MHHKINSKYILATIFAVGFTWILHEFAHWFSGVLLGYESIMQLNGTFFHTGENPTDIHKNIISGSGPFITIMQGIIAFFILKSRGWNKFVYPFLFIAFYMRLLAGLLNFINLNDEGRISQYFGIGTFTLSIIVSGLLFYLVYSISKQYKLTWKFQLVTILVVMLASSALILLDQYYGIRIL